VTIATLPSRSMIFPVHSNQTLIGIGD